MRLISGIMFGEALTSRILLQREASRTLLQREASRILLQRAAHVVYWFVVIAALALHDMHVHHAVLKFTCISLQLMTCAIQVMRTQKTEAWSERERERDIQTYRHNSHQCFFV